MCKKKKDTRTTAAVKERTILVAVASGEVKSKALNCNVKRVPPLAMNILFHYEPKMQDRLEPIINQKILEAEKQKRHEICMPCGHQS